MPPLKTMTSFIDGPWVLDCKNAFEFHVPYQVYQPWQEALADRHVDNQVGKTKLETLVDLDVDFANSLSTQTQQPTSNSHVFLQFSEN